MKLYSNFFLEGKLDHSVWYEIFFHFAIDHMYKYKSALLCKISIYIIDESYDFNYFFLIKKMKFRHDLELQK